MKMMILLFLGPHASKLPIRCEDAINLQSRPLSPTKGKPSPKKVIRPIAMAYNMCKSWRLQPAL